MCYVYILLKLVFKAVSLNRVRRRGRGFCKSGLKPSFVILLVIHLLSVCKRIVCVSENGKALEKNGLKVGLVAKCLLHFIFPVNQFQWWLYIWLDHQYRDNTSTVSCEFRAHAEPQAAVIGLQVKKECLQSDLVFASRQLPNVFPWISGVDTRVVKIPCFFTLNRD